MQTAKSNPVEHYDHDAQVNLEVGELQERFGEAGHPDIGMDKNTWARHVKEGHTDQSYYHWVRYWINNASEI